MEKPTCFCQGIMTFLMDNKVSAIWECHSCGRLLLKPYLADWQRWYEAQTGLNGSQISQKGK